jgi:hypothetical protein
MVNRIARINLAGGNHIFDLEETPKGLVEAKIDGEVLSLPEVRELKEWLRVMTEQPKDKE